MEKKILIVEDDKFVSELYQHQFTKHGFKVTVNHDGEKALDTIKKEEFDLILLDIMLPGIDGLEVLKQFRKDSKNKNTPTIVLSNLSHDKPMKTALELGAKAYIIKNLYTPDQVVAEVRSIVGF